MIQTVGKYSGYKYEDILQKDLPYCEFMLSLKYVKKENSEFVEWLKLNIQRKRDSVRDQRIAQLKV